VKTKTDVVIPARGESLNTLMQVLVACLSAANTGLVILVDNGLTPNIRERIYSTFEDRMDFEIYHCGTAGKGQALTVGLSYVQSERVMFCDADLTGLLPRHVDALTAPYDGVTLGITQPIAGHPPWPVDAHTRAICTGERCMPTQLARSVTLHGYATEAVLNMAAMRQSLPMMQITLDGVKGKARWNSERTQALISDGEWLQNYLAGQGV
jgi:glycosyltransferase involved in cell wall biosynthesis